MEILWISREEPISNTAIRTQTVMFSLWHLTGSLTSSRQSFFLRKKKEKEINSLQVFLNVVQEKHILFSSSVSGSDKTHRWGFVRVRILTGSEGFVTCLRDGNIPCTFWSSAGGRSIQQCAALFPVPRSSSRHWFHRRPFPLLTLQSLRWRGCTFYILMLLNTDHLQKNRSLCDWLLLTINGNLKGNTQSVVLFHTPATH